MTEKTIKELVEEFQVSKQAIRKRLTADFRANYVQTVTGNTANQDMAFSVLYEQLKEKDEQLKQLQKLLDQQQQLTLQANQQIEQLQKQVQLTVPSEGGTESEEESPFIKNGGGFSAK